MSMSRQLGDRSVFDRTHGPAVGASGDGLEGAYSAILNSAPSAGTVKVIVPNLWGLTTARVAVCSLAFTGSPGDRVLVVFDEEKQPWVVENLAASPPVPIAEGNGNGSGQTFTNGTGKLVNWNLGTYVHGGMEFNGTSGFIVPVTGVYRIQGQITLSSGNAFAGNGYFQAQPALNGGGFAPSNGMGVCATSTTTTLFPTATSSPAVVTPNAGDTIALFLTNQTGITVTLNEASLLVEFVSH
jgi:hypothetical protein